MAGKSYYILTLFFVFATFILRGQNPELTLQTGHSAPVTAMAFNSDGKFLATAGADNIIIIWDFRLGKQLKVLKGHSQKINAIQFLHQSNQLISVGDDGLLLYWDVEAGSIKQSFQLNRPVLSFDISENDTRVMASGIFSYIRCWQLKENLVFEKDITIWPAADSLKYIQNIVKKSGVKKSYKKTGKMDDMFSQLYKPMPTGMSVVFGANDSEIFVARAVSLLSGYNVYSYFDVQQLLWDGAVKKTIKYKTNLAYHKNGNQDLFLSGVPSRVSCYNLKKEKLSYTRSGDFKRKNFISISASANDSILAAVNEDGNIYKWKTSGTYLRLYSDIQTSYTLVVFHPIHKNILIAGSQMGDVVVIDISNDKIIRKLESGIHPIVKLAVNPPGNYVALGGSDHFISSIFLDNRITIQGFTGHKGKVNGMNFVSDSMLISSGADNRIAFSNMNTGITFKIKGNHNPKAYNAVANAPLYSLFLNTITSFDFARRFLWGNYESQDVSAVSPDLRYYASGGKGFNKGLFYHLFAPRIFPIHLINTKEMKKEKVFGAHYKSIDCIGFNFNSSVMVCSGRDIKPGTPEISKTFEKNLALSLLVPAVGIYMAVKTFAKNNVVYDSYHSMKVWDLQKKKLLKAYSFQNEIKTICFSPINDTMLIIDDLNKILMFDYKKDTIRFIASGKGPLLYFPDGKSFLYQDFTNSMVRFDFEQQKIIGNFTGHSDSLTGASLISGGKQLITTSLDGSMKIWNIEDGKEVATLYTMNNSDFIIKTPDYFYYSTRDAKKEIGFTFGTRFYPFEQFDLQYNRPDIVMERLGCASPEMIKALNLAYKKRLQKSGFSEEMFASDFHLPEIEIAEINKIPLTTNNSTLSFAVNASDKKYNLDRVNVWVNDVALYGSSGISLRSANVGSYSGKVDLTLSQGINKIRVSCMNEKGVESLRETIEIICSSENKSKPDLYIVAIGASEYADKDWNLNYASKDATDVVALFESQKNSYNKISTTLLLNKEVNQENIRKIKQTLSQTKVDDKVLVFYAGHGLLDDSLDYYLATYNVNFSNPSEGGLKYEELDNLLDSIPAREKMLLIDACHSGEVDKEAEPQMVVQNASDKDVVFRGVKPRGYNANTTISYNNSFELMKEMFSDLRKGTGAVVISSAGGGEYAFEGTQWKNGVFTYSLREGLLSGQADKNKDKVITVSELQHFVMDNVVKLTGGRQKPTMRQENIENDFGVWVK